MRESHNKKKVKNAQIIYSLGVFFILLSSLCVLVRADVNPQARAALLSAPLSFESNRGQIDARVMFSARGPGYNLYLTRESAVLSLNSSEPTSTLSMKLIGGNPGADRGVRHDDKPLAGGVVADA